MKAARCFLLLSAVSIAALGRAAENPAPAPKTSMKEVLKARIAEDARKAPPPPAKKEAGKAAETGEKPAVAETASVEPTPKEETTSDPKQAKTPATVLPKVEVKKGKYSERDRKLALDLHKQEKEIEREKKHLTISETDLALNDAKIARPLAIFGGESAQFRRHVAAERVELMEAEKDIIEQIAIAQKPEEKALLQKQLDEIREMRRQLDKTLR